MDMQNIEHCIVLMMVDGKWVQRPTTKEEQHFILPLLQEFDGGTLKVIPFPGEVTLNNK